jgi:hydrogenase nickel incorporation protein HypB
LRVVVASTTEGDDKPAKYPQMFAISQVMIINKLDLLPYLDYDVEKVKRQALAINPHLRIFELSCRTGAGLEAWCDWLMAFVRGEAQQPAKGALSEEHSREISQR